MKNVVPHYTVCLAGTPNSGKTTLFNLLTRSREHVGNYPGITVDVASAVFRHRNSDFLLQDLPGLYGLYAPSAEERVAVTHLASARPDLVLVAIDAANLERGLHLAVQILELGLPLLVLVTKTDLLPGSGRNLHLAMLQRLLKCPVIATGQNDTGGIPAIFDAMLAAVLARTIPPPHRFSEEIENEVVRIASALRIVAAEGDRRRYRAIGLLAGSLDPEHVAPGDSHFSATVSASRNHLQKVFGEDPALVLTGARYGIVRGILRECLVETLPGNQQRQDFFDRLLLLPLTGLPILLLSLGIIFFIPFVAGSPLSGLVEDFFVWLGTLVRAELGPGDLSGLLTDGIIGGVGGVLVFLPQLFLLFAVIAFIETSGYLARAAFVLDTFMHRIGLHGKSFLPFILGFGCTVPAILAARTLENRSDRLATLMALPFISCSARLPVFTLLIAAMFPAWAGGPILFSLYVLGITVALLTARFFRKHVFRTADDALFLMELPSWRLPTLPGILHQAAERTTHFLRKAGSVLLAAAVFFWVLSNFPRPSEDETREHTSAMAQTEQRFAALRPVLPLSDPAFAATVAEIARAESAWSNATAGISPLSELYHRADLARVAALTLASNKNATAFAAVLQVRALVERHTDELARLERDWLAEQKQKSYAGRLGGLLAPLLAPAGLDDWKIAVALVSGFAAKEMVVTTLGTLHGAPEGETAGLAERLRRDPFFQHPETLSPSRVLTSADGSLVAEGSGLPVVRDAAGWRAVNPAVALSLLVFILLYVPCQAATIVFAREAGTRYALLMLLWTTAVAWLASTLVYRIASAV